MKLHSLPVKRRPVPKGIFKRLRAVTGNRKQRVAAAATGPVEIEAEDSSAKISRALTIIFLIHIVAIGLIFIHQKFLDGRPSDDARAADSSREASASVATAVPPRLDLPRLAPGEKPYIVRPGDNYARIAAAKGVDEGDLRLINTHAEIVPGLLLKIPPKRIVAVEPPEVTAIRNQAQPPQASASQPNISGLVDAIDVKDAPKAKVVKGNPPKAAATTPISATPVSDSGKTYVVQSGDSIWRIANKFKVNQAALLKANGISDARKIKVGMNLSIPR